MELLKGYLISSVLNMTMFPINAIYRLKKLSNQEAFRGSGMQTMKKIGNLCELSKKALGIWGCT